MSFLKNLFLRYTQQKVEKITKKTYVGFDPKKKAIFNTLIENQKKQLNFTYDYDCYKDEDLLKSNLLMNANWFQKIKYRNLNLQVEPNAHNDIVAGNLILQNKLSFYTYYNNYINFKKCDNYFTPTFESDEIKQFWITNQKLNRNFEIYELLNFHNLFKILKIKLLNNFNALRIQKFTECLNSILTAKLKRKGFGIFTLNYTTTMPARNDLKNTNKLMNNVNDMLTGDICALITLLPYAGIDPGDENLAKVANDSYSTYNPLNGKDYLEDKLFLKTLEKLKKIYKQFNIEKEYYEPLRLKDLLLEHNKHGKKS